MKVFKTFSGIVAPLDRSNVDTDAIIPKEFLKSIKRSGFGSNLFDSWRYLDKSDPKDPNTKRKNNPDFVLNIPPYNEAEILLSRENFGCGSSREHAVWAITDFGIKAVLAPSFGDIFYSNSFKNGLLPVVLKTREIDILFDSLRLSSNSKVMINLEKQYVKTHDNKKFEFKIDGNLKNRLLNGLDDIALTLDHAKEIQLYEKNRSKVTPWIFK
mgnify:CR=1 FL=1